MICHNTKCDYYDKHFMNYCKNTEYPAGTENRCGDYLKSKFNIFSSITCYIMKALIYMTDEQHKKLKLLYAETGQRITETVRIAIDNYFEIENLHKVPEGKTD